MAKKYKQEDDVEEKEKQEDDLHNGKICTQIMDQLGKPENFCRCLAFKIRENAYRVNVRVKDDHYESLKDSFWVICDENGVIERTDPKISKKYAK